MTMVGFDVAKHSVVAAVVDNDGTILEQNVMLVNSDEQLLTWLTAKQQQYQDLAAVCESTGYYHYALLRVASMLRVPCRLLNPILTRQAIKGTIRGKKTDQTDAILIARLGLKGEGRLTSSEPTFAKTLLRSSVQLRLLEVQIRLLQSSLEERRITLPPQTTRHLIRCQELLAATVKQYRTAAAARLDQELLRRLCTIPGIRAYSASVLVSEIGDISSFSSSQKLIGFTGLDPRVRQSGKSLHRNSRLTKRGSPHLRRAIFMAANGARRTDPELKTYYTRKRAEGRSYTEAMMPVCRKLLARVYAVWKQEKDYTAAEAMSS